MNIRNKIQLPPDLTAVVEEVEANRQSVFDMTPQEYRDMINTFVKKNPPDAYGVSSEDRIISGRNGDIPIRVYTPLGEEITRPGIVYFLGGGFVSGTLDVQDTHCRLIAKETQSVVISVCYRLAPENPFPKGLEDAEDAVNWIAAHAEAFNIDAAQLSLVGYSSGGTFVASLAHNNKNNIAKAVLITPCLDLVRTCASHQTFEEGVLLDQTDLDWHFDLYLPDGVDLKDPKASPLYQTDFSRYPETLVVTAEYCPLRDEGHVYAQKLKAAGVPVTERNYNALHISFFLSPEQPFDERNILKGVCEFLTDLTQR